MKKQTTNIKTPDGIFKGEGHQVIIPGFESYQFTIHRPAFSAEGYPEIHYEDCGWQITENSTGMRVIRDYYLTKPQIIIKLKEKLEKCETEKFAKYVSDNLL